MNETYPCIIAGLRKEGTFQPSLPYFFSEAVISFVFLRLTVKP